MYIYMYTLKYKTYSVKLRLRCIVCSLIIIHELLLLLISPTTLIFMQNNESLLSTVPISFVVRSCLLIGR